MAILCSTQEEYDAYEAEKQEVKKKWDKYQGKLKVTKYPSAIMSAPEAVVKDLVRAASAFVREAMIDPCKNDADDDIEAACLAILVIAASNKYKLDRDVEKACAKFAECERSAEPFHLGCLKQGVQRALRWEAQ